MKTTNPTVAAKQAPEQLLYARWLDWGTRFGLLALVGLFLAYGTGMLQPQVPPEQLPSLWGLPVKQFLTATGLPTGWHWLQFVQYGDVANLIGICLLAGSSLPALLALLPAYLQKGERVFAAICLAETSVLLLAASGVLSAGH